MGMLVKQEESKLQTMEELTVVCDKMIKGGFLPAEIKTVQQAVAIAIRGRDLGINASQALSELYVVKGKVSMKAELSLQLAMERIPGFNHHILELSPVKCVVKYMRAGREPFTYTYTIEMAKNADLLSNPVWKKYPDYMLFNRNVSFALKMFAPDYKNPIMDIDLADLDTANQAIEDLTGKRPMENVIEGEFVVDSKTGEVITQDDCNCGSGQCDLPQEAPEEEKREEVVAEENKTASDGLKLICVVCGAKVTAQVAKYSMGKFGEEKCYNCQRGD